MVSRFTCCWGLPYLLLLSPGINYINLATARGINRAKEVGVRKTLGSAKGQLVAQFMLGSGHYSTCYR